MSRDEIVEKIIDGLRSLRDSNFDQEPYKDGFFSLFARAFNAGLFDRSARDDYLGTQALTEIILAKAPEVVDVSRLIPIGTNSMCHGRSGATHGAALARVDDPRCICCIIPNMQPARAG